MISVKDVKAMEAEIQYLTQGTYPIQTQGPIRPDLYPLVIEALRAEKSLVSHDDYKASLAKKQLPVAASQHSS
jgi:hypothetical protein